MNADVLTPQSQNKIVCPVKARPNQLCASEKGETSTAVVFVNAAGYHLKPLVIHKGACGTRFMETKHVRRHHSGCV